MKLRLLLGLTVFVGGTVWAMQSAVAQDKKPARESRNQKNVQGHEGHGHEGHGHQTYDKDAPGHGAGDMDNDMMAAWMKIASPGEHHRHLQPLVGNWTFVFKMRMTPDADWTESAGTNTTKSIMDGRYIVDHTEGESMGMPFRGMGITGYDNIKQKYCNVWVDNMGTMMMTSEGTCDGSGKVFTFKGQVDDPMAGRKNVPYKNIIRVINNDKHVLEWWTEAPDGKSFKMMEIVYTRA